MKRFPLLLATSLALVGAGWWGLSRGAERAQTVHDLAHLEPSEHEGPGKRSQDPSRSTPEWRPVTDWQEPTSEAQLERVPVPAPQVRGSVHFAGGVPGLEAPGTLEVLVLDPLGERRLEWAQVEVVGENWRRRGSPLRQGKSFVEQLPLGAPFEVRVTPPSAWRVANQTCAALSQTEPHRRMTVTLALPRPILRGAVVDAAGSRLAQQHLEVQISDNWSIGLTTDPRGQFEFWVPAGSRGPVQIKRIGGPSKVDEVAVIPLGEFSLGDVHDLGMVQLVKERQLLAGRFVLADGTPVGYLEFSVLHETGSGVWETLVTGQADADERVEVPWREPRGPIFLQPNLPRDDLDPFEEYNRRGGGHRHAHRDLSRQHYYLAQPSRLSPGQRSLLLVLRQAAKLSGSIEWEAKRDGKLTLRCTEASGLVHEIEDWPKRPKRIHSSNTPISSLIAPGNPFECRFEFTGLKPGFVTLEVLRQGAPIHSLHSIPVRRFAPRPAAAQNIHLPDVEGEEATHEDD